MKNTQWKEYKVGKLFLCDTTTAVQASERINGNIPYITRSGKNNGLSGHLANENKIVYGNCITIGAEGFTAFYQKKDFIPGVKVYTLRHEKMNEQVGAFIVSVLNASCYKYSYNRARILDEIEKESIALPSIPDGSPDWDYMESYIRELSPLVQQLTSEVVELADDDPKMIDLISQSVDISDFKQWCQPNKHDEKPEPPAQWKEYKVGELFDVETGKDFIYSEAKGNEIPVIGQGVTNNGVVCRSQALPIKLYNHKNTLSLAHIGNFYATMQKEDFYLGTRTKALIATFEANTYRLLFIATIINAQSYKFSYGRVGSDKVPDLRISLPATADGTLDWDYMESYIRSLPYSACI